MTTPTITGLHRHPRHHLACVEPNTGLVHFVGPLQIGETPGERARRVAGTIIIARGDVNAMTRVRNALDCSRSRSRGGVYSLPGLAVGSTRAAIMVAAADLALNLEIR